MSQPDRKTTPRITLPTRYCLHPTAAKALLAVNALMLFFVAAPLVEIPALVRTAALAAVMFNSGLIASRVAQIWQDASQSEESEDA